MPANLITLAHFSVSSVISFPNSAGVIDIGATPKPTRRVLILGSAMTALISLLSFSMILVGVLGGTDPVPTARFVARHKFANGGNVGQHFQTRRIGHRKGAQFTSSDVLDRCRDGSKRYLHLTAEQIGQVIAAIRDVNQVNAGHHLEQFAEEMWRGSY